MSFDFGLGNIIAQTIESGMNFWMNERNNQSNRKHDWAIWNAQNEYNLPVNQMQRLRDAGLNPNLVYDKGATTLAAPFHSTPNQAGRVDVANSIAQYQQMKQQDAMTQQIKAQQSLIDAQTRKANADADIAEHNKGLIDGTDYIMGENFATMIARKTGEATGNIERWLDNKFRNSGKTELTAQEANSLVRQKRSFKDRTAVPARLFEKGTAGNPYILDAYGRRVKIGGKYFTLSDIE